MAMPDIKVSVLFTTYKQEAYVRSALRSVLAQDFSPLEIILSDDASPDGTFEIVKEEVARYTGPHTLVLQRNTERRGGGGVRTLSAQARGSFIVLAHGDDIALPHRVRRLVENAVRMRCSLVASNAIAIDGEGRRIGMVCQETQSRSMPLEEIARTGWTRMLLGATFGFHRHVQTAFGTLDSLIAYQVQDHATPIRAALLGGIWYEAEPLMEYRYHPDSMSARSADRTASADIARATIAAHELGGPVAMLATFDQASRGRLLDARLRGVRDDLLRRVAEHAQRAVVAQNRLRIGGLRAVWRPAEELDARPAQPALNLRPEISDTP